MAHSMGEPLMRRFRLAWAAPTALVLAVLAPGSASARNLRALTAAERATLVDTMHKYLDTASDKKLESRNTMLRQIESLASSGEDLLADLDALTSIVYSARSFSLSHFCKKCVPKGEGEVVEREGPTVFTNVKWGDIKCTVSVPKSYPIGDAKKIALRPPCPMIVSLHELEDFIDRKSGQTKEWPGEELIKRRWDTRGPMKAVTDEWIVYAPVVTRANWLTSDGAFDNRLVQMKDVWQRYNVDFDRIVIEGGSEALLYAASQTIFFAGVIVRGDKADVDPVIARNIAHLSVYVVGTDKTPAVQSLQKGGFPASKLKVGGPEGLPDWLKTVKRTTPTAFHWAVKDPVRMTVANWVMVTSSDPPPPGEAPPTIDAEVVDTADDPNTIRLKTRLVRAVQIFLNDRIVDLSKPVRVVVNDKPVTMALQLTTKPEPPTLQLPVKVDRSFDLMFDLGTASVRNSQYFGWLFPAGLLRVEIKTDAGAPAAPATDGSGANPPPANVNPADPVSETEQNAQQYFRKAQEAEAAGEVEKAKNLYKKAVDEGESTVKAKAEERLKALSPGASPAAPPAPR
jgi:hypothetical protein